MKPLPFPTQGLLAVLFLTAAAAEPVALFDGKSLEGWSTADADVWRVQEGAIVAGDGERKIQRNSFLNTEKAFDDFEFRCRFKLTGDPSTGMINSGIQFRSEVLPDGNVRGYQADIGDPSWWGSIYDEHRRNKVLAQSDMEKLGPKLDRDGWNTYVIRCEGPRIQLWINDVPTVDFTEPDPEIPREGVFSLQVHGGGAAMVQFKDITVEVLEVPESPLSPEAQKQSFRVPDGFSVELVASEETGLPKPITVAFDDAGRMWSITATEYPLDANENKERAMALWRDGGGDRVVVFDDPTAPGPHTARIFADGLAMPMGVMPYLDGAIVGQGPEIVFLRDSDGDGRADRRERLLHGFGVQDSHLLPHQFTRMPGGWVLVGQGAFNRSAVLAGGRAAVEFDYCKLGRFRLDGSEFETVCWGPNNIWGLVHTRQGELFLQEANDLGHAVIPFQNDTSVEGIGQRKFREYAPFVPKLNEFRLGGTGLSGLALSDDRAGSFPEPWKDVMFVANPITRTVNAVRLGRGPEGYSAGQLPDFLSSGDPWFRPVAMTFGPDGCLYIVDFYNKIISHNEVPRSHPDRDKTRGRVWRVRHESQQPRREIPDLTALSPPQLVERLDAESTWEMRAAWHQLADRGAETVAAPLRALRDDPDARPEARVHALWLLPDVPPTLLEDGNADVRREAATFFGGDPAALGALADDPDHLVRGAAVRSLAGRDTRDDATIAALLRFGRPLLDEGTVAARYNREYERTIARAALEGHPQRLAAFLDSEAARALPPENRLFATLALTEDLAAPRFVRTWAELDRQPDPDELHLILKSAGDPALKPVVEHLLGHEERFRALLPAALEIAGSLPAAEIAPLLAGPLKPLVQAGDPVALRAVKAFKVAALEGDVLALLNANGTPEPVLLAALDALAALPIMAEDTLATLAADPAASPAVRRAAVVALAASESPHVPARLAAVWGGLSPEIRQPLYRTLSQSRTGARALVHAGVSADDLAPDDLARMRDLLPDDAAMDALWESVAGQFQSVLRLDGHHGDYAASAVALGPAFTVECWVRLDPDISNADGILGHPGPEGADLNFFDGRPRFYAGPELRDVVVAETPVEPNAWVHLAFTHAPGGPFRLFRNGELDAESRPYPALTFASLDVGRTVPGDRGTAGEITEFRVWDRERSAAEIRADFDRTFHGDPGPPAGLTHYYPGAGDWPPLHGNARVAVVADGPKLLSRAEAIVQQQKLRHFHELASRDGDPAGGKVLFDALCLNCHTLGDRGAKAAPALDGSGHRDLDGLLRSVLTPDAAVEAGYRARRVGTTDGRIVEGFLVKEDPSGTTLRLMGGTDLHFSAGEIAESRFLDRSFMPAGLVDGLGDGQVADLFTYIRTLR